MPVKKSTEVSGSHECSPVMWSTYGMMGRKLMATLAGILLVYGIIFVGTLIRNNLKKYETIGRAEKMERTIIVEADGKITATPDIALTTMGMTAEGKTVAEAQKKNTEVINKLVESVKILGVEKKDIQTTNYNIYPTYDYKDGKESIRGYQVSQSITVKIRNLDKADDVIALAGEVGANNVSGLQFTVDDPEIYKAKAREIALKKIAAKRAALARSLGVRLTNIVSYNEYEVAGRGQYEQFTNVGGMEDAPAKITPTIEVGSNEISVRVNIVFEVQQ